MNLEPDRDNEKTKKKGEKKEKKEKKGKKCKKSKKKDTEEKVEDNKYLNKKRGKNKNEEEEEKEEEEKEELQKKKIEESETNIIDKEKEFKKSIELIEKEMINKILDYLKSGVFPRLTPTTYMNSYTAIKNIFDYEEEMPMRLVKYHDKTILDFIIYCFKKFELESKTNFVNNFILYTEKINFLIYWMNRIFSYVDNNINRDNQNCKKLSIIGKNLYTENFFNKIEEKVYKEINKLIKEDRNNNIEERDKIKFIIEIIKSLDYFIPQIIKEKNKIKWIELNQKEDNKIQREYEDKWFKNYFKNETIIFVKRKGELDINNMSAPE